MGKSAKVQFINRSLYWTFGVRAAIRPIEVSIPAILPLGCKPLTCATWSAIHNVLSISIIRSSLSASHTSWSACWAAVYAGSIASA